MAFVQGVEAAEIWSEVEATVRAVASGFSIPNWDREDLVQEVALLVCQRASDYRPGRSVKAWARVLATRRLIDIQRREAIRRRMPTAELVEEIAADPGIRIPAITGAPRAAMTRCQSETLLRLIEGDRQYEIARDRGVTRQAVHNVVRRARAKIAQETG